MERINEITNNQKTQVTTNISVINLKENTTNSGLEFNFGNGTMDIPALGNIGSDEFEQELRGY
jgi:hypothetical protein